MSFVYKCTRALLALFSVFLFAAIAYSQPPKKPLTSEQLIEMSTQTLKSYPNDIIKYIKERGVTIFPSGTTMRWLQSQGVAQGVVSAVKDSAVSNLRIKICRFTCDDAQTASEFNDLLRRALVDAKKNYIPPFGFIPLDDKPAPPEGFNSEVKPEANIHYILLQGSMKKDGEKYRLETFVVHRDPSGIQHPLQDAPVPVVTLTKGELNNAARGVIDWCVRTLQCYAK